MGFKKKWKTENQIQIWETRKGEKKSQQVWLWFGNTHLLMGQKMGWVIFKRVMVFLVSQQWVLIF